MIKIIAKTIATGLGSGLAPVAPGTFGTAFGLLCYVGIAYGMGVVDNESDAMSFNYLLIGLTLLFTIIGTWSVSALDGEWGHDPGKIIIDEVVGVWITLFFVPFSWENILLAFIIFRFFDILKPLGIKKIDKQMHTSFSVMLDDILAGVYSAIVLHLIIYFM